MSSKRHKKRVLYKNCPRGHGPERIVIRGKLVCPQCLKMRKRYEAMLDRCYNPANEHYKNYGARGIIVCPRWKKSFSNWYSDIGYLVDGNSLTIDRVDNNKGYFPGNCRATTAKEQNSNKRTNVNITFDGVTLIQNEWIARYGVPYSRIHSRIGKGFPSEYVLFDVWISREANRINISHKGETHSLRGWCSIKGLSYRTVQDRIYVGNWTYGQALGMSPKKELKV